MKSCMIIKDLQDTRESCDQLFTESTLDPLARIDHAEKFLHATGAKIAHGGTRAYYRLSTDAVQMPPFESFRDADKYYSTLCHELTHWTSAKNRFGSNAYAQEELVAELGTAFLCADLELALEPREDHASNIANWLEVLQNDSRAVFTAAHAQKAADFIHKFSASTAEKIEEPCAAEQSFALPGRFCHEHVGTRARILLHF